MKLSLAHARNQNFKMAERIKRTSQPPKRLLNEYLPVVDMKKKKKKKSAIQNQLYEIEVVAIDKQEKKVKIHYKGYGEEADEWRDCREENMFPFERLEKVFIPGEMSLEDRTNIFHERVYQEINEETKTKRRAPVN